MARDPTTTLYMSHMQSEANNLDRETDEVKSNYLFSYGREKKSGYECRLMEGEV